MLRYGAHTSVLIMLLTPATLTCTGMHVFHRAVTGLHFTVQHASCPHHKQTLHWQRINPMQGGCRLATYSVCSCCISFGGG